MIISETVTVRWSNKTRKHYEKLGYVFTHYRDIFKIPVNHLPNTSGHRVLVSCDVCKTERDVEYQSAVKGAANGNLCWKCKNNHFYGESLFEWATKHKPDILRMWDYDLNDRLPNELGSKSGRKVYLKCLRGLHDSKQIVINELTRHKDSVLQCDMCNSIAQYLLDTFGDNALNVYWGSSNKISPWKVSRKSQQKIFINCLKADYHGEYDIQACNFVRAIENHNNGCGYCKGAFKTHRMDSFAQYHIDRIGENFLVDYWDYEKNLELGTDPYAIRPYSSKSIYVKCIQTDYHGSYCVPARDFTDGHRCSYCSKSFIHPLDSLGSKYPNVTQCWSERNVKSIFEVAPCVHGEKYWWKCPDGIHEDFQRSTKSANYCNYRCPECVRERDESMLQEKIRLFLRDELNLDPKHEHACSIVPINPKTNMPMPFDNEVLIGDVSLIIECHGEQHFKICFFHYLSAEKSNISPEEEFKRQQWRDDYKMKYALSCGYEYLIVPYWAEKNDLYQEIINNKIKELEVKHGR